MLFVRPYSRQVGGIRVAVADGHPLGLHLRVWVPKTRIRRFRVMVG
jgi:hypothetical protein